MFHYSNRSIHFRVQFHRKTGLSLQGCWEGLSCSHARVPACITRWLGWVLIFFFFFFPPCLLAVMVLLLWCYISAGRARLAALQLVVPGPARWQEPLTVVPLTRPPELASRMGPCKRASPCWGTELFAPPLLMVLAGPHSSLKCCPWVTTSLHIWEFCCHR